MEGEPPARSRSRVGFYSPHARVRCVLSRVFDSTYDDNFSSYVL